MNNDGIGPEGRVARISDGGVVVKRVLQPIGYFVAAVCLLVAPFALVEGWPRLLLIANFTPPACLAIWLGIEKGRDRWRGMEND
jgi:hypothetical protein